MGFYNGSGPDNQEDPHHDEFSCKLLSLDHLNMKFANEDRSIGTSTVLQTMKPHLPTTTRSGCHMEASELTLTAS